MTTARTLHTMARAVLRQLGTLDARSDLDLAAVRAIARAVLELPEATIVLSADDAPAPPCISPAAAWPFPRPKDPAT